MNTLADIDALQIGMIVGAVTGFFTFLTLVVNLVAKSFENKARRIEKADDDERRRKEREREWEREDEVARRVALATEAMAKLTKVSIGKMSALETGQKKIYHEVNSGLTASYEVALTALRGGLLQAEDNVALKKEKAEQPSPQTLATIEVIRQKIFELEGILAERRKTAEEAKNVKEPGAEPDEAQAMIQKLEETVAALLPQDRDAVAAGAQIALEVDSRKPG